MREEAERYREQLIERSRRPTTASWRSISTAARSRSRKSRPRCGEPRSPGDVQPVVCGSAFKNKGIQQLLDAVLDYLPSPLDVPPIIGHDEVGAELVREPKDDAPFSALVFKIMTDPFVGQLAFFRVYSGHLDAGSLRLQLDARETNERIGRLLEMHANKREEIKEVWAGDIAAAVGLRHVSTGDRSATRTTPSSSRR